MALGRQGESPPPPHNFRSWLCSGIKWPPCEVCMDLQGHVRACARTGFDNNIEFVLQIL